MPCTRATTCAVNSSPSTLAATSSSRSSSGSRSTRSAMAASARAGSASQSSRSPSVQRPASSRTRSPRPCMAAQQLHGEQRVAARPAVERFAEPLV